MYGHPGDSDVWELWYDIFGMGSEDYGTRAVIAITDDDKVVTGKISECSASWVRIGNEVVSWDQIRFMSYEGFPVRKILCSPPPKTMRRTRSLKQAALIRRALHEEFDGTFRNTSIMHSLEFLIDKILTTAQHYKMKAEGWKVSRKRVLSSGLTFGDPFEAEFVSLQLLNPGNSGDYYSDEPDEETVLLQAADGTPALVWDLPSVLAVEAA